MGSHQAKPGKDVIDALSQLDKVLKYRSRREWPIPGTGDRPQAIDLCWFFDSFEGSPLFAFEFESKDTTAAQGNANKLFAKSVEELQKPLFFFHLFLDGHEDAIRQKGLLSLYGKYNYGVYSLKSGALEMVFKDILRQHRRLADRLRIFELGDLLSRNAAWQINLDTILGAVLQLGFERGRGTRLSSLGKLLIVGIDVRPAILRELLERLEGGNKFEHESYNTWLGNYYQEAFHWAMLACLDPTKQGACVDAIINWQNGDGTRPIMIGPMFGRRQEYDNFVVCWAPAIWAMLTTLVGNSSKYKRFACEQIDQVVREAEKTSGTEYMQPRLDADQSNEVIRAAVAAKAADPVAAVRCAFEMLIDDDGVFSKGIQIADALRSTKSNEDASKKSETTSKATK